MISGSLWKEYSQQFEEERTMLLLSNRSLRGIERGKEIGALQKARDYIKAVLRVRLGELTLEIETYLMGISDLSVLDELLKLAVTVDSLEDFRQSIGRIQAQLSITEN
jgi:hypothetical protein